MCVCVCVCVCVCEEEEEESISTYFSWNRMIVNVCSCSDHEMFIDLMLCVYNLPNAKIYAVLLIILDVRRRNMNINGFLKHE